MNSDVEIQVTDDSVIYAVGQIVVVRKEVSGDQSYFEGHNSDVTCLAYNATRDLVASGQFDPKGPGGPFVCVWSPKFCEVGPFAECR